jgi:REP element-mobilizing transposase RayT
MPNHIHLLLTLSGSGPGGASPSPTITDMVGTLKSQTSRLSGMAPLWQRSYYDHVIRNGEDYRRIAEYIEANPDRWNDDEFHP